MSGKSGLPAGKRTPAEGDAAPGKSVPMRATAPKPCPICGKPPVERYRPFCSKRCADIDLNRWLSGAYAIPVVEEEDEDGDMPPPARERD